MFPDEEGKVLTYKTVYNMYNRAFKKCKLKYSGTQVARRGGTREVLNMTGDISISQQHLGNASISATMVYAQRDQKAFDQVVLSLWDKHNKSSGVIRFRKW